MAINVIFLMVSCTLVIGSEAGCSHLGMRYVLGQLFEIGGCLKCECTNTGVICETDCPPVKCEDGSEPFTAYGRCCPSCPIQEQEFEFPIDGTPPSAIS